MNKNVKVLIKLLNKITNLTEKIINEHKPFPYTQAEEIHGEVSEFLAHLEGDYSSMDEQALSKNLINLSAYILKDKHNQTPSKRTKKALAALESATTLVYNMEGDRWQMAYEVLEALLANLKIETPKELCDE